jgi:hypothetical protein
MSDIRSDKLISQYKLLDMLEQVLVILQSVPNIGLRCRYSPSDFKVCAMAIFSLREINDDLVCHGVDNCQELALIYRRVRRWFKKILVWTSQTEYNTVIGYIDQLDDAYKALKVLVIGELESSMSKKLYESLGF